MNFVKNVGKTDRIIRIVVGICIIVFLAGWWKILGVLILLTGFIGWCGLYQVLGSCCPFSKNKEDKKGDKPQGGCCGK
jgi:chromate transport protein ChrA